MASQLALFWCIYQAQLRCRNTSIASWIVNLTDIQMLRQRWSDGPPSRPPAGKANPPDCSRCVGRVYTFQPNGGWGRQSLQMGCQCRAPTTVQPSPRKKGALDPPLGAHFQPWVLERTDLRPRLPMEACTGPSPSRACASETQPFCAILLPRRIADGTPKRTLCDVIVAIIP